MESTEDRINRLIDVCARLKRAKKSLETEGYCPETEMKHEDDPYNIGFIYASIRNALSSATESLNSIIYCGVSDNLKELIEKSGIFKND